jgi:nucleoside-diphosphate kinase
MSKAYANSNHVAVANLVHASGNAEEAAREIEVWFAASELHDYRTAAEHYVH